MKLSLGVITERGESNAGNNFREFSRGRHSGRDRRLVGGAIHDGATDHLMNSHRNSRVVYQAVVRALPMLLLFPTIVAEVRFVRSHGGSISCPLPSEKRCRPLLDS